MRNDMTAQSRVEFFADEYQRNHGASPKGRGSWAFQVTQIGGHEGQGPVHFSPSMTLGEAKRWMAPIARADAGHVRGITICVDILP